MEEVTKSVNNDHTGPKGENGSPDYVGLWKTIKEDLGLKTMALLFFSSILLIFSPAQGWQFDFPLGNELYTLTYRAWLGILGFIAAILIIICKQIKNKPKKPCLTYKNKNTKSYLVSVTPAASNEKKDNTLSEQSEVYSVSVMSAASKVMSTTPTLEEKQNESVPAADISEIIIRSIFVQFSYQNAHLLGYMTQQLAKCQDYKTAVLLLLGLQRLYNGTPFFSFSPQPFAVEKADDSSISKGEGVNKWCWWRCEKIKNGDFQLVVSLCK